jgi:hypothetical protein
MDQHRHAHCPVCLFHGLRKQRSALVCQVQETPPCVSPSCALISARIASNRRTRLISSRCLRGDQCQVRVHLLLIQHALRRSSRSWPRKTSSLHTGEMSEHFFQLSGRGACHCMCSEWSVGSYPLVVVLHDVSHRLPFVSQWIPQPTRRKGGFNFTTTRGMMDFRPMPPTGLSLAKIVPQRHRDPCHRLERKMIHSAAPPPRKVSGPVAVALLHGRSSGFFLLEGGGL